MYIEDLDGKSSYWKIKGREITNEEIRPRSSLHKKARDLLKKRFKTIQILEEVKIKPYPSTTLYLDFYVPLVKLAVEVHGEQHYKYNSLYHNTQQDFLKQLKHDKEKEEWCRVNGIQLIILKYDSIDNWEKII